MDARITHGHDPLPGACLEQLRAVAEGLGDWHRERIARREPTCTRCFFLEHPGGPRGGQPGEEVEAVEHRVTALGDSLSFRRAIAGFLAAASEAARLHPGTTAGFAVVHVTTPPDAPGCKVLVSKLFVPGMPRSGNPAVAIPIALRSCAVAHGHTMLEYWDPGCPETGFTRHPWDSGSNHIAFATYMPSPFYCTAEEARAFGETAV